MELIDKSAVVAEIGRRKSQFISQAESFREIGRKEQENYFAALASNMNSLSCFINTLEVIEVGLDLGDLNGDKSSEYVDAVYTTLDNVKPYLRPLSSMTEEERRELQEILGKDVEIPDDYINIIDSSRKRFSFLELQAIFDWLNAHHFDFRNLIERELAIDCTGLNAY